METTAIFIVTDPAGIVQLEQLTERFLTVSNPADLGVWNLEYRLLRSAETSTEAHPRGEPRHQAFLTLSHHPGKSFVAVDGISSESNKRNGAGNGTAKVAEAVIAVPVQQRDDFYRLIVNKMAALWTPRTIFGIQGGATYDNGEHVVRIGELRQLGVQQSTTRALVTSIHSSSALRDATRFAPEDEGAANGGKQEQEIKGMREAAEQLWKSFGIAGAKQLFCVSKPGDDGFEEIRLWCDALRLRT